MNDFDMELTQRQAKEYRKATKKQKGEICAERLHPDLAIYIDQLEKNDLLKYFGRRDIEETKKVSERTIKSIHDKVKTLYQRLLKTNNVFYYL